MSEKKPRQNILSNHDSNVKLSSRKKRELELKDKASSLPLDSGCYLMKNSEAEIIYVGKAKNLKNRVQSYFNNSAKSAKTEILVGHIRDFDFILTNSDAESFVLENNLIKKHKPKYNIRLKDDKSYPYVSVNFNEDYPRLEYVRRPKKRKNTELFGPYPVGSNIGEILKILTKLYSLRDCSKHDFNTRKVPCILYQMKQCSAGCVDYIDSKSYKDGLRKSLNYFKSEKLFTKSLLEIEQRMFDLASEEEFERAAFYRDQIDVLKNFKTKSFEQSVELQSSKDIDIFSYYLGEEEIDISLYLIRRGNLLGHKNFHFLKTDMLEEVEDEIARFLLQYYVQNEDLFPQEIITPLSSDKAQDLKDALVNSLEGDLRVKVLGAVKRYKSLIDTTTNHAKESQSVRIKNQESVFVGLNRLKALLSLSERPKTLECYDIAVWQGKSPTAAQIVFYEGKPDKSRYRHYHMTELPEGNNDFAMMKEVFSRRLKKGDLPDVFIVDGGVGQVNTVKKVLDEFNLSIPLVGIAKAKDLKKFGFRSSEMKSSEERLVIPGRANPFILNKCPSLLRIVVQMRDEAHRFSRRLHHKSEKKRVIHSWVDEVRGISAQARELILRNNTLSVDELKKLNVNEIQNLLGLNLKYAKFVHDYLHTLESSLKRE